MKKTHIRALNDEKNVLRLSDGDSVDVRHRFQSKLRKKQRKALVKMCWLRAVFWHRCQVDFVISDTKLIINQSINRPLTIIYQTMINQSINQSIKRSTVTPHVTVLPDHPLHKSDISFLPSTKSCAPSSHHGSVCQRDERFPHPTRRYQPRPGLKYIVKNYPHIQSQNFRFKEKQFPCYIQIRAEL